MPGPALVHEISDRSQIKPIAYCGACGPLTRLATIAFETNFETGQMQRVAQATHTNKTNNWHLRFPRMKHRIMTTTRKQRKERQMGHKRKCRGRGIREGEHADMRYLQ